MSQQQPPPPNSSQKKKKRRYYPKRSGNPPVIAQSNNIKGIQNNNSCQQNNKQNNDINYHFSPQHTNDLTSTQKVLILGTGFSGNSTLFYSVNMDSLTPQMVSWDENKTHYALVNQLRLMALFLKERIEKTEADETNQTFFSSSSIAETLLKLTLVDHCARYICPFERCADVAQRFIEFRPDPGIQQYYSSWELGGEKKWLETAKTEKLLISDIITLLFEPIFMDIMPYDCSEYSPSVTAENCGYWIERAKRFWIEDEVEDDEVKEEKDEEREGNEENGQNEKNPNHHSLNTSKQLKLLSDFQHSLNPDQFYDRYLRKSLPKSVLYRDPITSEPLLTIYNTETDPKYRKKSSRHYKNTNIVLFLFNLADYSYGGDRTSNELVELRSPQCAHNVLEDSLRVFRSLVYESRLTQAQIIVCFNGYDALVEKLPFRSFSSIYKDYHGDDLDPESIVEWIKERYLDCCTVLEGAQLFQNIAKVEHSQEEIRFEMIKPLDTLWAADFWGRVADGVDE